MVKFQVLKYNQAVMARMGLYSNRLTEPSNEFFNSPASYYFLFTEAVLSVFASAVYIHKHWPQFDIVSQPCLIVVGGSLCFAMFLSVGLKVNKIKMLHLKLQEMVDEVEDEPEVNAIFWNTEKKCRKYFKILAYFIILNQALILYSLVMSIYGIAIGNYDTSAWKLPFFISVPFNTESIWGWYLLLFININIAFAYSLAMVSLTSYFISCCFYIKAVCQHFDFIMKSVEKEVELNQHEKNPFKYKKREQKIKENLCNAINTHTKVYEIFDLVADIYGGSIFALFPPNVILTALALYNVEHSEFDIVMFAINMICLGCGLCWSTIFAYFATCVSDRISTLGFTAYDCNWFNYPVEIRKYMILIIARSQKPAQFNGLKLFPCTLQLYGDLFKTSCSYYWIFRSLAHR